MLRNYRLLLALLLAVGLMSGAAAQDSRIPQTFFMTFVPNIQFAPVYVALEKGYFAEAGIDLVIEHGDEPVGVDLIAANERQFGLVSGEEVIKARANGRPVVYVYEWFQRYPVGIVAPEGLESVQDLAGRRVGIPGRYGASYNGLVALLAANGMAEADIQLEPIGFNAPDVFCIGGVEASVIYVNNEPVQIRERIKQNACNNIPAVQVFAVADAADLVSNGLVTNERTIAENPDLVRAMVTAFDRGLRDVINNPAEAYLLSARYVGYLATAGDEWTAALEAAADEQRAFLAESPGRKLAAERRAELLAALSERFDGSGGLLHLNVLMSTIALWDADDLGLTTLESWQATQEILLGMAFISEPIDLEQAFTNDFVPLPGDGA